VVALTALMGHKADHGGSEVWGMHNIRHFGHCGGATPR